MTSQSEIQTLMKFIIIWIVIIRSACSVYCPAYCKCHMREVYRYVGCTNSKLSRINQGIPSSVEWLELSNNSITQLKSNTFLNLTFLDLRIMSLKKNGLYSIDAQAFKGLNRLQSLDLSENRISKLDPWTFEYNKNLLILNLSFNHLIHLSNPFLVSHSLQRLYLKSCSFRFWSIPEQFGEMPSLKLLDLSDNYISKMLPSSLDRLSQLTELYLNRNGLECSQISTYSLITELKKRGIKLHGVECPPRTRFTSTSTSRVTLLNGSQEKTNAAPETTVRPDDGLEPHDSKAVQTSSTKTLTEFNAEKKNDYFSWLVIVIVSMCTFFLGAIMAYSTVALYVACSRRCSSRSSNQHEVIYLTSSQPQQPLICNTGVSYDPSAPPPDYNQLFGASSCR